MIQLHKQAFKFLSPESIQKIKEIMSKHQPETLDEDLERDLREYVAQVERREQIRA